MAREGLQQTSAPQDAVARQSDAKTADTSSDMAAVVDGRLLAVPRQLGPPHRQASPGISGEKLEHPRGLRGGSFEYVGSLPHEVFNQNITGTCWIC